MTFFMSHVHRWRELQMMSETQFSTKNGGVWSFVDWQPNRPRVLQSPSFNKRKILGMFFFWEIYFHHFYVSKEPSTPLGTFTKMEAWKIRSATNCWWFSRGPRLESPDLQGAPNPPFFRWSIMCETSGVYGCFLKWWVFPPSHPLKNRVFHINPSILGLPQFLETPHIEDERMKRWNFFYSLKWWVMSLLLTM